MLRACEGALSEDVLDIIDLEQTRQSTVKVLESAVQSLPPKECSGVERDSPSIFQAIHYVELDGLHLSAADAPNEFGVAPLVKADIDRSLGLCFGFLHYLGSSAVYRAFEDSPNLTNKIGGQNVGALKAGMLATRANLRARIYNFTEEENLKLPDKTKYAYLEFLASQAIRHLSPGQTNVNEIAIKRCIGGILAGQKVFTQLTLSGYEPRYASIVEELKQVDILIDEAGVELQVKGNAEESTREVRVTSKERAVPKVTVSTSSKFPRFRLLGTGAKVLITAVDRL